MNELRFTCAADPKDTMTVNFWDPDNVPGGYECTLGMVQTRPNRDGNDYSSTEICLTKNDMLKLAFAMIEHAVRPYDRDVLSVLITKIRMLVL